MSQTVKLDENAYQEVLNEVSRRVKHNLDRRTRKDVASDLVIKGSQCKEKKKK